MKRTTSGLSRQLNSLAYLIRGKPWERILIGMVLGIFLGLSLSPQGGGLVTTYQVDTVASWLALPGKIFLAVVIPLVVASIILGIAASGGEGASGGRRLAARRS